MSKLINMNQINLSPQTAADLNNKANMLIGMLKEAPSPKDKRYKNTLSATKSLETGEIIDIHTWGWEDEDGKKAAIFFEFENKKIGYYEDSYLEFIKIVNYFVENSKSRDLISTEKIENILFDWIKQCYKKDINISFTEYSILALQKLIENLEIWIPLSNIEIETELKIGNVLLKKLDEKTIEKWKNKDLDKVKNGNKDFVTYQYKKRIEKYKDLVFSINTIVAEKRRAYEIAYEDTEKALTILRLYSPYIKNPNRVTFTTILGKENLQSTRHLVIKDDYITDSPEEALSKLSVWKITNSDLCDFKRNGIDELASLFFSNKLNDFQKVLLNSLSIYSKSSLYIEIEYKLILIFSALESIFVEGDEPIQQNLGERIALQIGNDLEERKEIKRITKQIYKLRSRFVHNALKPDAISTIKLFMLYVWKVFIYLIMNNSLYKSKKELIEFLEDRKLS